MRFVLIVTIFAAAQAAHASAAASRNGYDTEVMTFSPEGRLHQVEYAQTASLSGTPIVGLQGKNCAVLAARKRVADGAVAASTSSFFKLGNNWCGITGYSSDAVHLANIIQLKALEHNKVHGYAASGSLLARHAADVAQASTQNVRQRPLATTCLLLHAAGITRIDPTGGSYDVWGCAIGKGMGSASTWLEQR
jgi:20S proteasome subunit alpha 6